jgi:hypothetical protein
MTTISTFGAVNAPVNFSLFNDNGAWYMLVVNLGNGNLTRFSFSTNLKNNSPAAISLGNPNNRLFNPRAISIIADENDLYALITNESSRVTKVSFRNGITNTPTATDHGITTNFTCLVPAIQIPAFTGTITFIHCLPIRRQHWPITVSLKP